MPSRYDAFGNEVRNEGAIANKYLFAGEQFDSGLGDYYLRDRYYESSAGRFTRRDTYEGSIGEPLTLHKYSYANNNPVNFIDPTGFFTVAELNAAESIRMTLAGIQTNAGAYLISATQKRGDYKINGFLIDVSWNAAFALAPLLLPYIVSPVAFVLRRAKAAISNPRGGSGTNNLPTIGEIAVLSVLRQLGPNACGSTCGTMLLRDYGVNVTRTQYCVNSTY